MFLARSSGETGLFANRLVSFNIRVNQMEAITEIYGIKMSAAVDKIAAGLAKAQAKFKAVDLDSTNPFFHSKYASLKACFDSVRGPLLAEGITVVQGSSTVSNVLTVTTLLLHTSGQYLATAVSLLPKASDPQAVGSALSYGRRYGLMAAVGQVADVDDDGNAATHSKPTGYNVGAAPGNNTGIEVTPKTKSAPVDVLPLKYDPATTFVPGKTGKKIKDISRGDLEESISYWQRRLDEGSVQKPKSINEFLDAAYRFLGRDRPVYEEVKPTPPMSDEEYAQNLPF